MWFLIHLLKVEIKDEIFLIIIIVIFFDLIINFMKVVNGLKSSEFISQKQLNHI